MSDVFHKKYKIVPGDVDRNQRLRLSMLFNMIQNCVVEHTEQLGAGRAKTLDKGLLWVITMQRVEIKRLPVYDEEVILSSIPGNTMRLFFPRFCNITDKSGNIIIRTSAIWTLIDKKSRHIINPEDYGIKIDGITTGNECRLPSRVKAEKTDYSEEFTVPFSYSDINGHMSNTKYFDLADDTLPFALKGDVPELIEIEYDSEAKCESSFTLSWAYDESGAFIRGDDKGKKIFLMSLKYPS